MKSLPTQRFPRLTSLGGPRRPATAGPTAAVLWPCCGSPWASSSCGRSPTSCSASATPPPPRSAWIRGGSPTRGFLGSVDVGPLASTFHAWAGTWWADWLFMAGLLGIGLALLAGVTLRITAVAGTVMLLLMWAAEWPPARFTVAGEATHSTHPFLDYHIVYALVLVALATTLAGNTWGFGHRWATFTGDRAWLR